MSTRDDNDWIPRKEAALIAECDEKTIYRWAKAGHIVERDGPKPPGGGSPIREVKRSSLMMHLVASGKQPRPPDPPRQSPRVQPDDSSEIPQDAPPSTPSSHALQNKIAALEIQLMKAEAEILAEKLRGEIAALIIDRDAQASRAELLADELQRARDRVQQLEAENLELRKQSGTPWWRRLLSGPTS